MLVAEPNEPYVTSLVYVPVDDVSIFAKVNSCETAALSVTTNSATAMGVPVLKSFRVILSSLEEACTIVEAVMEENSVFSTTDDLAEGVVVLPPATFTASFGVAEN